MDPPVRKPTSRRGEKYSACRPLVCCGGIIVRGELEGTGIPGMEIAEMTVILPFQLVSSTMSYALTSHHPVRANYVDASEMLEAVATVRTRIVRECL